LKKLRTSDGWSTMSLQAQQLAEHDVIRELEEAWKARIGHATETVVFNAFEFICYCIKVGGVL